jgi:nucleotide-binding universal stress UspA family protein
MSETVLHQTAVVLHPEAARRVMVCVDGSVASHDALDFAVANFNRPGTEFVLVHCYPYPSPQFGGLVVHFPSDSETAHAAEHELSWLAHMAHEVVPKGTPV